MKNTFLLIAVVIFNFAVFAQDVELAIKYNDRIVELNVEIITSFGNLVDSYDTYIPEQMDSCYTAALNSVDYAIANIMRLDPFENDSSFKIGAFVLFKTCKKILEGEHALIIELLKLPDEKYGNQQLKEYEKYIKDANNKWDRAIEKLMIIQDNFVKKYNIKFKNE